MRWLLLGLSLVACTAAPVLLPTQDAGADAPAVDVAQPVDAPAVDAPRPLCVPGAQVSCACGGVALGYQVCADDGARLGPCVCPDAGIPGVDVGAVADVPPAVDAAALVDVPVDVSANTGCPAGFADCDHNPANGCEADLSSIRTCGTCDHVCPTAFIFTTEGCMAGVCRVTSINCMGRLADCDHNMQTGCEVDLQVDPANCGACGNSCGRGGTCVNGVCH